MDTSVELGGSVEREDDSGIESSSAPESSDSSTLFIRVSVPEQRVQKCLQFHCDDSVWVAKQKVLATLAKDLKDGLNYGLYCPPINGRAGKFLDEERPLRDYPLPGPIGFLEFKYKRRVYKMIQINPTKLRQLRSKANLRQFLEAVKSNNCDKIIKFLNKGLDPNFHDPETGETPFTLAAALSKPRNMLVALASGGAHVDFRARDGLTSMHKAAARGNHDAIKCLLDLGASPNYKDARGLTPLYYCVSNPTNPFCVELLLHDHALIGTSDERGWCEIHQACKHGRVQHLEHLLFYGADMNARNSSGNTPLHVCSANNQESCARVLLFRGADKGAENYANQDAYQVATIAGNYELAEVIRNYREEDVVPFQEVPKFNDKRRSIVPSMVHAVLQRSRSDSRLNKTFDSSKPPSPALSNNSLPHYASSNTACDSPHMLYRGSYDSDSPRSMSISSAGSSSELPAFSYSKKRLYPALPGRTFICVKDYEAQDEAELALHRGDFVQVLSIGEQGYWEGKTKKREGWFPSHCVEEVHMRQKNQKLPMDEDAVLMKRQTLEALVRHDGENVPRTVVLQKTKAGYGFVLRGAKSQSATGSNLNFSPTSDFPALQYLDRVDKGSMADKAGLRPGDFVLEINNESVVNSTHEHAVRTIKNSGDTLVMKVITIKPQHNKNVTEAAHVDGTMTMPAKRKAAPMPPRRHPNTSLSVSRAKARSMLDGLATLDQLDRTLDQYDTGSHGPSSVYGSFANMTKVQQNYDPNNKTASIRSRPAQRMSSVELEEIFSRQGPVPSSSNGHAVHNYANPAELHGSLRGSVVPPLERARSSPNLAPAADLTLLASTVAMAQNEMNRTDSSATYANVENDGGRNIVCGVPVLPQYASLEQNANVNRTVGATVISTNEGHSGDGIVIPPPPLHAPPLPPYAQTNTEVVKINTSGATPAVYANVSKEIQAALAQQESPYESSFRPGTNAKMNKAPPPPIPTQHAPSQQRRSSNGGYSTPYQHQSNAPTATTVNHYHEPYVAVEAATTLPMSQEQVMYNNQSTIVVTADIHVNNKSQSNASNNVPFEPQKTTIFIPEPDYDNEKHHSTVRAQNLPSVQQSAPVSAPVTTVRAAADTHITSSTHSTEIVKVESLVKSSPETPREQPNKPVSHKTSNASSTYSSGKPRTTSRSSEPEENEVSKFGNAIKLAAIKREKRRHEEEEKKKKEQENAAEVIEVTATPAPPPPPPPPPPAPSSQNSSQKIAIPPPPSQPPPPPAVSGASALKPRPKSNLPAHIQKQIEENKRHQDSHAALMAAIAKRRNIVDQTDMDAIAETIESRVQRTKKLQSTGFKGDKAKVDTPLETVKKTTSVVSVSKETGLKSNDKSKDNSVKKPEPSVSQQINKTPPMVVQNSLNKTKNEEKKEEEKAELDMTVSSAPINAMLTNYNYQKNNSKSNNSTKPALTEEQHRAESIKAQAEKARREWLLKRSHSNLTQKPEVEQRNNEQPTASDNKETPSVKTNIRNLPQNPSPVALGELSKVIAQKASSLKYGVVDDDTKNKAKTFEIEKSETPVSPTSKNTKRSSSSERQVDKFGNLVSPTTAGNTKFYGGRARANGTSGTDNNNSSHNNNNNKKVIYQNGHNKSVNKSSVTNGKQNSQRSSSSSSDLPFDLPPPLTYSDKVTQQPGVVPPPPAFDEHKGASKPGMNNNNKQSGVRNKYSRHLTNDEPVDQPTIVADAFIPPPPLFDNMENVVGSMGGEDAVSLTSSLSTLSSLSSGDINSGNVSQAVGSYSFNPGSEEIYAEISAPPPPGFDDNRTRGTESEPVYEEVNIMNDFIPPPVGFGVSSSGSDKNQFLNKTVQTWSISDVGDWLESLQLSDHQQNFKNHKVDGISLTKMGRNDFIALGVTQVGHRMNMERAIKKLMLNQK